MTLLTIRASYPIEMEQDIRWRQRFHNFENALRHLEFAVTEIQNPSDLEKEGTIQRFEFTHELAWKVMKDFLTYEGTQDIMGSRSATRVAFNYGIIADGQIWMDMIESRNLSVYTYNEGILEDEYAKITSIYFNKLKEFYTKMQTFL